MKKTLAALALAAALPMSYAATAHQSFGDLSWTLTDLAPGDGIAPAFELWTGYEDSWVSKGETWGDYENDGSTVRSTGPAAFDLELNYYMREVELAPKVAVTFSRLATVSTSGNARAQAGMSLTGGTSDFLVGCLTGLGEKCTESRVLSVTIANNGDAPIRFDFLTYEARFIDSTGEFTTTPVPEPETWALMLAGLAGLAHVSRSRSGRGTPRSTDPETSSPT